MLRQLMTISRYPTFSYQEPFWKYPLFHAVLHVLISAMNWQRWCELHGSLKVPLVHTIRHILSNQFSSLLSLLLKTEV